MRVLSGGFLCYMNVCNCTIGHDINAFTAGDEISEKTISSHPKRHTAVHSEIVALPVLQPYY